MTPPDVLHDEREPIAMDIEKPCDNGHAGRDCEIDQPISQSSLPSQVTLDRSDISGLDSVPSPHTFPSEDDNICDLYSESRKARALKSNCEYGFEKDQERPHSVSPMKRRRTQDDTSNHGSHVETAARALLKMTHPN